VIRVLLNIPSPALRAGLRALLSFDRTIKVVAAPDSLEADDEVNVIVMSTPPGHGAALASALAPTFQASTPLGVDADSLLPALRARAGPAEAGSGTQAAILLLGDEPVDVQTMKRLARVWGILPADSSAEELTAAIHALSQGLVVGAPALLFESESEPLERGPLTERESEVLALLAKGLANKQIAVALGISEHTVKFHVSSIYQKLNVTNRTEAVREGLRGGWIAL
jgi:DNA-binding NarL/FixJ family response regulator